MESNEKANELIKILDTEDARSIRQLKRVQTLIDVIYGVLIFHLLTFLPQPTQDQLERKAILEMFAENGTNLLIILIGFILILIYWTQNNKQFGYLRKSDNKHAIYSIIQMFCLMIYLYFMRLDNETEGLDITLLMQSVFLALAGFIGVFSWKYAEKNDFFMEGMTPQKSRDTMFSFLSEPITAVVTIPFAFLGPGWYTIAWLSAIPIGMFLKRQKNKVS